MKAESKLFRRGELIALSIAVIWAGALLAAAFTAPLYKWESEDSSGVLQQSTSTLVEVNGTYVALMATAPLVLSLATAIALWLRGRRRGAGPMAWTLTILCAALSLVSILSIGLFVLPVVGCLIYACAVHGRPKSPWPEFEFSFPRISRNASRRRHEP